MLGHPEQDFTLSEPLSPHWKSRGVVPTFPSWQSTCHIGDTCGCCRLAIQHSLQTPLWGNPFIAEGGELKKTFLRLSCSLSSRFDFSFNSYMHPNNTWIWNRVKERERFQEVKCLFCWHILWQRQDDSCQQLPKEWLPTGATLTFLMMGVLGAGSCSWMMDGLEFAPLALQVNVEAPHTWHISP